MSSRDLFAGGDSIRLSACSASDCMLLDLLVASVLLRVMESRWLTIAAVKATNVVG